MMNEYFDSPRLEKVRDEGEYSIYMVRINHLLLNEKRFLILMSVKDNFPPFHIKPMSEINWISLQTRVLHNDYPDIITHSYDLKRGHLFETPLFIETRTNTLSTYKCQDLPIVLSLLHTRNNEYEYPNEGVLNSALETYRTIIQFLPPTNS